MTTEEDIAHKKETIHTYIDKIADAKVLRFIEALLYRYLLPEDQQRIIHA